MLVPKSLFHKTDFSQKTEREPETNAEVERQAELFKEKWASSFEWGCLVDIIYLGIASRTIWEGSLH